LNGETMKKIIILLAAVFFLGCGGGASKNIASHEEVSKVDRAEIDSKVESVFGKDDTNLSVTGVMKDIAGNWYGKKNHIYIWLQLRKDGTYFYRSRLGIGKFHNYYRYSEYNGTWSVQNGNSQIVLKLPDTDAPLVISNFFPQLETPAGVTLDAGKSVNYSAEIPIEHSLDKVEADFTQRAENYLKRKVNDFQVDYFTMVAAKANSESFWGEIKPKGYNYGHKLGLGSEEWEYALKRIETDGDNYVMVISDESWQTLIGGRGAYRDDIQNPVKMYKWFEFFKDQMQILGRVKGTVLYIIAGDAPAYWAGDITSNYGADAKKVPAKLIESRFPEVLERKPDNSFAGVFQMMDYLRMKYAPNVKLGYTLKTWGIAASRDLFDTEKDWSNDEEMQIMADYLNSFGVQFDFLSFNFNPRSSSHTTDEYKSASKYFGEISKHMLTRDGFVPKVWIWKVSLWNEEHTTFYFQNIEYLVNECNAIGMTLGHGNDLKNLDGFRDNPDSGIYIKSWLHEYFLDEYVDNIPKHATKGVVKWR